jgi:hypothetical protein
VKSPWIALGFCVALTAQATEPSIFDAHVHYNDDVWDVLTPKQAVASLRAAGAVRALVSSSNDEGTQKLFAEAPDLIVPELRPYRNSESRVNWHNDEKVLTYLEARLKQYRYVAIGELHLNGAQADSQVVQRVVQLAKKHNLMLHVHSDADAVNRIFKQDPDARILWAHAGFEEVPVVAALMRQQKNLWADLSFRYELANGNKVTTSWRALLLEFPDRFMLGSDTYIAERWFAVNEHAAWARRWLADLPKEVAERIALRNGEQVFTAAARRAGVAKY